VFVIKDGADFVTGNTVDKKSEDKRCRCSNLHYYQYYWLYRSHTYGYTDVTLILEGYCTPHLTEIFKKI
jgi:hypothetical protein